MEQLEHPMRIIPGDFSDPRVIDLLRTHLTSARAETAPGSAHALDLNGLQSPDIDFWTMWEREVLLGVGALKRLPGDHGEVKSLQTSPSRLRRSLRACSMASPVIAIMAWGSRCARPAGSLRMESITPKRSMSCAVIFMLVAASWALVPSRHRIEDAASGEITL